MRSYVLFRGPVSLSQRFPGFPRVTESWESFPRILSRKSIGKDSRQNFEVGEVGSILDNEERNICPEGMIQRRYSCILQYMNTFGMPMQRVRLFDKFDYSQHAPRMVKLKIAVINLPLETIFSRLNVAHVLTIDTTNLRFNNILPSP